MNPKAFRAELVKIMPGYDWTVHRPRKSYNGLPSTTKELEATGTMTGGKNRLSTLSVIREEKEGQKPYYKVKSSGYGRHAPWLAMNGDSTLAHALRGLQDHYEYMASKYRGHAAALEYARQPKGEEAKKQVAESLTTATKTA